MTTLQARTVSRPWGAMRVREAGAGPTLLAVHGLGGSGRYWERLAAGRLGGRAGIVAPDLAGFGGSDKPRDASYDLDFHAADLDAALRSLAERGEDADRVVAIGHSIGGVIALAWAAARAPRVSALALVATPFPEGDGEHAWMREATPPAGSRAVMRAFRILVPVLSVPVGVARRYPPAVAVDYARQGFVGRARTSWWALHDPGVTARLQRAADALAAVPVLLAYAADDRTVDIDAEARWAELLPNAERVIVPRGGHQFLLHGDGGPTIDWLEATLRA